MKVEKGENEANRYIHRVRPAQEHIFNMYIGFVFPMPRLEGGKFMSKHHHHDDCCCAYPQMYGMSYGMGGGAVGGYGGGGCGAGGFGGAWGIRWIYALLILIVIVLQFGRKNFPFVQKATNACESECTTTSGFGFDGFESIDRSVLFIIVVFLLILCAGCFWGGGSGYAAGGAGFGGYGY